MLSQIEHKDCFFFNGLQNFLLHGTFPLQYLYNRSQFYMTCSEFTQYLQVTVILYHFHGWVLAIVTTCISAKTGYG